MDGEPTATKHGPNTRRVTVAAAAEILGITAEAVRTRIKREKLRSVKDAGTVYVLLEADQTGQNIDPTPQGQDQTADQTERIDELRDRVAFLERELERRGDEAERLQRIIAGLAQANTNLSSRLPELEAPREGPESPGPTQDPTEPPAGAHAATEAPERENSRPWWRRVLGG